MPGKSTSGNRSSVRGKPTRVRYRLTKEAALKLKLLAWQHYGRPMTDDEEDQFLCQIIMEERNAMAFYAVAHHGSAGLDSFGHAEVIEGDPPHSDQTTSVWGPYDTREAAEQAVIEMEVPLNAYREAH